MRLVILTTETTHHAYFVREIAARFDVSRVLVETHSYAAPFETHTTIEDRRDEFERAAFFGGRDVSIGDFADTVCVSRCNTSRAIDVLTDLRPDVVVVFGTGKLSPDVISTCPDGIVNLHGGAPEAYRGLDSHYWAIYHRDFEALVTTLHRVNPELDDGEIILQGSIPLHRGMELFELRRFNTEVCAQLTLQALESRRDDGRFRSRPQEGVGRYYSFMPAVLKSTVDKYFRAFTEKL